MMQNNKPNIQVVIRKRPLNDREIKKQRQDIVDVEGYNQVIVKEIRRKVDLTKYLEKHCFHFDAAFDQTHYNEYIYSEIVQPLIQLAFDKGKVSCFAYGQTGSGKTHTMMGNPKLSVEGLYLLASRDIFQILKQDEYEDIRVGVSFYEIYCDKAYDLLNEREECPIRVDARENVNIVGLNEKLVPNSESIMSLINTGLTERITSQNSQNNTSSRSHAILQITLRNIENGKRHGKLSFIDLAGSERGADVKTSDKQTRIDGAEINKSLLALKECIRALDQGKKHLPFRGSKLTLVLKDSFVGKCKTVMIGCISPSRSHCEDTLNTLRYADRVKELKEDPSSKQHSKNDKLMLRSNKYTQKEKIPKPSEDSHLVFETFDVTKKNIKSNQSLNDHGMPVTGTTSMKYNNKDDKKKSFLSPMHSFKKQHSQHQNVFKQSNSKERDTSKKNFNFLKKPRSKSPIGMKLYDNMQKLRKEKTTIEHKHKSSRQTLKDHQSSSRIKKNPNNTSQMEDTSFVQKSKRKVNPEYENMTQQEMHEKLLEKYTNHIENLFGIGKSDRRNLQMLNSDPSRFTQGFDKMIQNLDKKISIINKLKYEIHGVKSAIKKQQTKKQSISDDPFLLNSLES